MKRRFRPTYSPSVTARSIAGRAHPRAARIPSHANRPMKSVVDPLQWDQSTYLDVKGRQPPWGQHFAMPNCPRNAQRCLAIVGLHQKVEDRSLSMFWSLYVHCSDFIFQSDIVNKPKAKQETRHPVALDDPFIRSDRTCRRNEINGRGACVKPFPNETRS